MSDFRTMKSFEVAFRKAIPNFDETKIWFKSKGKMYNGVDVCFVNKGKLETLHMYCATYEIEQWKKHFIEFCETGEFEFVTYWQLYGCRPEDMVTVHAFPMCKDSRGRDWTVHSPEHHTFLMTYRRTKGDCGIKQVPKP